MSPSVPLPQQTKEAEMTQPEPPDRTAVRQRPFCAGCGTYFPVHGEHRRDCTNDQKG